MAERIDVDPQFWWLLDLLGDLTLDAASLADTRAGFEALSTAVPAPDVPGLVVEDRSVPGAPGDPDVGVRLYLPERGTLPTPALLWIHGGGMVMGSPSASELTVRNAVAHLGWPVVSVDYRLAPEHPYPGPLADCVAAFDWLVGTAVELGVDASRIGVVGESAGGGLAAGLALRCRDRGAAVPAFQVLVYPMLDDRTVVRSEPSPHLGRDVWTPALNRFGWASYLGVDPGSDGVAEAAAPGRAADLTGLPPTFVSVGALDLFLEEDVEYARRLARAGVPVELHVFPRTPHGFAGLLGTAPLADEHALVMLAALRRELGGGEAA